MASAPARKHRCSRATGWLSRLLKPLIEHRKPATLSDGRLPVAPPTSADGRALLSGPAAMTQGDEEWDTTPARGKLAVHYPSSEGSVLPTAAELSVAHVAHAPPEVFRLPPPGRHSQRYREGTNEPRSHAFDDYGINQFGDEETPKPATAGALAIPLRASARTRWPAAHWLAGQCAAALPRARPHVPGRALPRWANLAVISRSRPEDKVGIQQVAGSATRSF